MRRFGILLLGFVMASASVQAEEKTHREWFREALEAAEAGDLRTYASSMAEALAINTVPSNRPFMLYHLARARALGGDQSGALEALDTIWNDDIERLLIYYVLHDSAFAQLRATDEWAALAARADGLELEINELRENLYAIEGAGSWILALSSEEGWLLVDSGYEQASTAIRQALDTISTRPVVAIVNTHEHEDHVGGNARFGKNTIVVAHPAALEVLSREQEFIPGVNLPPKTGSALPNVLTDRGLTLPLGDERVHVRPIPAHSGSDLAVVFERANVIHMGDGFFPDQSERIFPGEDAGRFLDAMNEILVMTDDQTLVYSGHSSPVPVSRLRAAVAATESIWNFTRSRIEGGLRGDALAEAASEAGHPSDWVAYFEKQIAGD